MNNPLDSIILRSDSYKYSHDAQLRPDINEMYNYLSSRGGVFPETTMFGLNYYLKEYFSKPIITEDIDVAEELINAHMGPNMFNREGWEAILHKHNGFLPLRICAVREGVSVPAHNVLMTIQNTDLETTKLRWVPGFAETLLLKLWYPITIATLSRTIKKTILRYLEETGDPSLIDFKLHDFGYRGVSSEESAGIGGLAHLVNFKGSDTVRALIFGRKYYNIDMAAWSIPAMEHSTIASWGEYYEADGFRNMVVKFGDRPLYACVSDTFNIYNAVENIWGMMLRDDVLTANGTLVVRPDSGIPHEVVLKVMELLGQKFGFTVNGKGYKVLNPKVRVIQGDGLDGVEDFELILETLKKNKWSADNIAFGMGGGLLQKINRDTNKFAIKASSMTRNGRIYDVYKNPVTDPGKAQKRGRFKLINDNGFIKTVSNHSLGDNLLIPVWENGKLLVDPTMDEIRARAAL